MPNISVFYLFKRFEISNKFRSTSWLCPTCWWFFTKNYSFISLCLRPEMWQKVEKFKGAEYFRKALYVSLCMGVSTTIHNEVLHCFSLLSNIQGLNVALCSFKRLVSHCNHRPSIRLLLWFEKCSPSNGNALRYATPYLHIHIFILLYWLSGGSR